MTGQTRFYVQANGIKIHYLELAGDGPVLVLIPGITSPAFCWQFVAERLAKTNHVYVLDNRGRGLSAAGPGLTYTLDDYAADTAGVISALDLDRPAVLGHSMGARIAVRLAASHGESVGKAVIVDPPVSGPGRRLYPNPLQWYLDMMDAADRGAEMDNSLGWNAERVADRARWLPTCSRAGVIASHEGFHSEDIFGDFAKIACPTLLVYAELGGTVMDQDADEMLALIPDALRVKIDGVGHMIPWDNLDAFIAAVTDFITT